MIKGDATLVSLNRKVPELIFIMYQIYLKNVKLFPVDSRNPSLSGATESG
jgi:hypothetical protein